MSIRLWPRSLIGQLVLAVAAMLFVAQGINFAMLARGQKQQTLAHGGGMAVARIIDAIDRDRRGRIDNGAASGRHDRFQKLRSRRARCPPGRCRCGRGRRRPAIPAASSW